MPLPNLDDPILKHTRTDFAPLRRDQTVGEALAEVRAHPPSGRIVYFYVVDEEGRLCGVLPTRLMLLSPDSARLREIMIKRTVAIPYNATVMHACELFTLHKFLAFPVVDEHRHFLGVVDLELYTDEIADLAHRTGYEDLFQFIGVRLEAIRGGSSLVAFRRRFPWLLCNIAGGILSAFLAGFFQGMLDRVVVLALFIPVVLNLSESVGVQSVSLAIQTLHGEGVKWGEALRSLRRELLTGLLLGLGCGLIVAAIGWAWKGPWRLGACLTASIAAGIAASAVVGLATPLVIHWLKRDPEIAAGPIALVLADLLTLLIYFNVAAVLMDR